jgi:maltose phosphorylase
MYFLEERFDEPTIRRNYDFYEPRTVHESSLSPCIHSILAAKLGYVHQAYELYLRTSRLDLDDYNREVHEGLHITSMAGTWMSIVEGFGGMRVRKGKLQFDPVIHEGWKSYSFKVEFRGAHIKVRVLQDSIILENVGDMDIQLQVKDKSYQVRRRSKLEIKQEVQVYK